MAQAVLSRTISSADFTSRASSIVCCPSRTVIPAASSAASMGGSTMSTPIGMSATPSSRRISAIWRAAARQQREARHLVARPLADVGAGDVADVVEVEEQQRAEFGGGQRLAGAAEAVGAQPLRVDPLLPVDVHQTR